MKRKGKPGAGFWTEAFDCLADDSPPEFQIKLDRPLIVGKGPNENGRIAVLGEIFARHLKESAAETKPLEFRGDIKLKNLAAIRQQWHPVAAVAGVTADRLIKVEHKEARPPAYGGLPPGGSAPRDHAFQFQARDEAPVSAAPGSVMHGGDPFGIAFARIPYGDDRLDHLAMLRPLGLPPQELFRNLLSFVRGHCTRNTVASSRRP